MNKNYVRGRNFEYEIKKILTEKGYFCVRSASSKTCSDLICLNDKEVLLIQAKRSKKPISDRSILTHYDSDIVKLQSLTVCPNVFKQLWVKVDRKGIRKYNILKDKLWPIK